MNIVRLGLAVILVASGALMLLLMSTPDQIKEPDHVKEQIHRFNVGDVSMALALTEVIKIEPLKDPRIGIRLDFRPGHRQPRQIELTVGDAPCVPKTCSKSARMRNGVELQYRTELNSGGSGGAEANLIGVLSSRHGFLNIHCHTQSEFGPNPEWCMRYLRQLRIN